MSTNGADMDILHSISRQSRRETPSPSLRGRAEVGILSCYPMKQYAGQQAKGLVYLVPISNRLHKERV